MLSDQRTNEFWKMRFLEQIFVKNLVLVIPTKSENEKIKNKFHFIILNYLMSKEDSTKIYNHLEIFFFDSKLTLITVNYQEQNFNIFVLI
ncbi:hypothetical protein BpHYR1_009594 [Brachionus plicatilis]|uniref:Uncharacterized protein n=1 Tax=Brachionus plicatilis TaxID=10195 RepID=A0A3M7T5R2_BRAPC|nr:hypothetical protein BpHYR1_009594 [Brachionus plicatilis]